MYVPSLCNNVSLQGFVPKKVSLSVPIRIRYHHITFQYISSTCTYENTRTLPLVWFRYVGIIWQVKQTSRMKISCLSMLIDASKTCGMSPCPEHTKRPCFKRDRVLQKVGTLRGPAGIKASEQRQSVAIFVEWAAIRILCHRSLRESYICANKWLLAVQRSAREKINCMHHSLHSYQGKWQQVWNPWCHSKQAAGQKDKTLDFKQVL